MMSMTTTMTSKTTAVTMKSGRRNAIIAKADSTMAPPTTRTKPKAPEGAND